MADQAVLVVVCTPPPAYPPPGILVDGIPASCMTPDGQAGVPVTVKAYLQTSQSNWDELSNMSMDDAHVIGAQVALVWAIAWGFRAIRNAVLDYNRDGD